MVKIFNRFESLNESKLNFKLQSQLIRVILLFLGININLLLESGIEFILILISSGEIREKNNNYYYSF